MLAILNLGLWLISTMVRAQKFWIAIILVASATADVMATHVRAAEITYKRITAAAFTYEFTLTGYTDTGSPVRFGDGIIDFGDGWVTQIDQEAISFEDGQLLGPNNEVEVYVIKILHTYVAPGHYRVGYFEPNRNDEVVNINNGNSTQTSFYIEGSLWVDPVIGLNSSPVLTNFPIDRGVIGQQFSHNPWAYDAEGDSLVYRLVVPLQDQGQEVPNYERPNLRIFIRIH